MGRKSFYAPKIKPSSLVLGSSTLNGVTGSADTVQNSDNYLMSSARVNASIAAKNTSTPVNTGNGAINNWISDDGNTKYRTLQPWATGISYSSSAKGYSSGGSYAYLNPMYLGEDVTVKGVEYSTYHSSASSQDEYLYLCFYNLTAETGVYPNMPGTLQGWVVCKAPSGTGAGSTYFSTIDLGTPSDRTHQSGYNHMFNSSGTSVSSLSLPEGHYWLAITTNSTGNLTWRSWGYSHRLTPRMLQVDVGVIGFPAAGFRINGTASHYNPSWEGGMWLSTWKADATNKGNGTWAPPSTFNINGSGNATKSHVDNALADMYMNMNFPNVKLLCE